MDDNSKPVFKMKAERRSFKIKKKWLIVVASVMVLFVAGGLNAWYFIAKDQSIDNAQVDETETEVYEKSVEADTLANMGDSEGAVSAYDEAIDGSEDDLEKIALMISKATIYFNEGNYDEALSVMLEAKNTYESSATASFTAQIYEAKSDKENAVAYYQKAIDLLDETNPVADSSREYYQFKIDELNGEGN